jgi:protein-tyrosine phosphatase
VESSERAFEVVFVCTGNRFRSPIAEGVLRAATQGFPVQVRSVGTLPSEGEPAFEEAMQHARNLGLDIAAHRSCRIDAVDLSRADLVVGFEFNHMAKAVVDAGADRRRTFLLPELVEYLERAPRSREGDVVARAARAVEAAAELRVQRGPGPPAEIPDPAGRPLKEGTQTVEQIATLTTRVARLLFPT